MRTRRPSLNLACRSWVCAASISHSCLPASRCAESSRIADVMARVVASGWSVASTVAHESAIADGHAEIAGLGSLGSVVSVAVVSAPPRTRIRSRMCHRVGAGAERAKAGESTTARARGGQQGLPDPQSPLRAVRRNECDGRAHSMYTKGTLAG